MSMSDSAYARHVGRIGALAVALGIGAAVASSPGVAWASPDDGGGDTSSNSNENSGPSDNTQPSGPADDGPGAADPKPKSGGPFANRRAGETNSSGGSSQNTTDLGGGVVISHSGGANSTDEESESKSKAEASAPEAAPLTTPAAAVESSPVVVKFAAPVDPDPAPPAVEEHTVAAPVSSALRTAPDPEPVKQEIEAAAADVDESVSALATSTLSTVGAALTSLFGSPAGGPAVAPLSWIVMAAARREVGLQEQSALTAVQGNSAPVAGAVTTQTAINGVVTGKVAATDPENDGLTFSGTATTSKGQVVVNRDGTFTYTPTVAARHAAAASAAARTDTFTVTITDANGAETTKTVTVGVLPKNSDPAGWITVSNRNPSTGQVTITVVASDLDKDTLTVTAPGTTPGGTLTRVGTTNTWTYTPSPEARAAAGAAGVPGSTAPESDRTHALNFSITDGHGGVKNVVAQVNILPGPHQGPITPLGAPKQGYQLATFPSRSDEGSGQTDASGKLYVPVGTKVNIYDENNVLIKQATLREPAWFGPKPIIFQPKDIAPSPDGSYIYVVHYVAHDEAGKTVVDQTDIKKFVRGADGNYTYDPTFKLDKFAYGFSNGEPVMREPQAFRVATDHKGYLYIAQGIHVRNLQQFGQVVKYDTNGHVVEQFGHAPNNGDEQWLPGVHDTLTGIAVSPDGNTVYTTENTPNTRVQRWDWNAVTGEYEPKEMWGNDAQIRSGGLPSPYDVAVDSQGIVYVVTATAPSKVSLYYWNGDPVKDEDDKPIELVVDNYDPRVLSHGLAVNGRGDVISPQSGRMWLKVPTPA